MVFYSQAQQPKDTLAQLYRPYQGAMSILLQNQRAMPRDSLVFAQEWQRLNARLKHLSDSIAANNTTKAPIYFEYQRLIDQVTYNTHKDSLQPRLNNLYAYTALHQDALVENGPQFNKIAKCLVGVTNDQALTESAIIAHNTSLINALYKQLNTTGWDAKKHQDFFSFFAAQYTNTSNIGMAEKLYRQFDSLLVHKETTPKPNPYVFLDSLNFVNGLLKSTNKTWKDLKKGKIVIQPQEQSLFALVYLVRTLWAWDKTYQKDYDIIVLRNKDVITDEFLKATKRNLAFYNYHIASYTAQDSLWMQGLPRYATLTPNNTIDFASQDWITFFNHLNVPIAAQQAVYDKQYKETLQKRKAARQKVLALPIDASEKYSNSHQRVKVTLKGYWQDSLSTKITPVRWTETDTLPKTKKPYLAQLQVFSRADRMHQCFVFVNGKKQNISLMADRAFNINQSYKRKKNTEWYNALTTIDSTLMLQTNYELLIASYPFAKSDFVSQLKIKQKSTESIRSKIIKGIRNKKSQAILQQYADKKKALINQKGI
jgi:hypothetical protein